MVGSSLVTNAFVEARQSYDGCSLGLKRNNFRVWWQGKGDMSWGELVPRITLLLQYEPPKILVIHCGGNSIGIMPLFHLRRQMKEAILKLHRMLPYTKLVWSQILSRLSWRYSNNCKAINMAAVRLNNFAAWLCFKLGGSYIKYPEISWDATGMFAKDGVHLSRLGNSIFLFNIQSTLHKLTALL